MKINKDEPKSSLSRRMFVKILGWVAVIGNIVKMPATAHAAGTDVVSEAVHFEGKGGTLGGYLSKPAGKGPYPGVLVIHENKGITDYVKDVTKDLAREGYVGLSVNLVSRGLGPDYPGGSDEATAALGKLSDDEVMADLDAGVEYLKKQPVVFTNSVGCMGFCMGGRYSLLFAEHSKDLKAAVTFYGKPVNKITPLQPKSPLELVSGLSVPLLGNYGAADTGIPVADVNNLEGELKRQGKVFDIKIYPDAQHAFHNPGPRYHETAAKDAWRRTLDWFAKYLKSQVPKG